MDLVELTRESFKTHLGPDFEKFTYLIAVSGGADSMALLSVCRKLLPGARLAVAHFDHGLRGTESDLDRALVARAAKSAGVRFYLGTTDVTPKPEDEASLRRDRLRFLSSIRAHTKFDFILTAHHAQDQLETFLIRLLRGAGVDGLGGMKYRRGSFFKPFLAIAKKEISLYCEREPVEFREDRSNFSPRYLRNRIRRDVVPALLSLGEEFGGERAWLTRVGASLDELREASRERKRRAARRYRRHATETPVWIRLPDAPFRQWSKSRRAGVMRYLVARLGVEPLGRRAMDGLLEAMDQKKTGHAVKGVRVRYSCGHFFFQTAGHLEKMRRLRDTVHVVSERWACPELGFVLELDPEVVDATLRLRFFRPGDRFGEQKLKHLFLKARIPAPERALVPLFVRGSTPQVIWHYPLHYPGLKCLSKFPFSFEDAARQTMPFSSLNTP